MESNVNPWKSNLTNGLILGLTGIVYSLVIYFLDLSFNKAQGPVLLVIQIALLYFLLKSYRDNYMHGQITYGQSFGAGAIIFLYYAVIMAVFTYVLYTVIDTELLSKQLAFTEETMVKKGMPQASIDAGMAIQSKIMKPAIMAPLSIIGIMLWGVVISLLVSIFIRKEILLLTLHKNNLYILLMDLSVVIPLYNEEESIQELAEWITRVCSVNRISFEIIFVDDGSSDSSWDKIVETAGKNRSVKGFRFRRNYGKAAALHTGFAEATGEVVITMDSDLQDSPDEIPELVKMIRVEGFDIVSGWKKKRYDPFVKRITSKFYNGTARWSSGIKLHDFNCGLKAYRLEVVKSIEIFGEMHRYIPMLAKEAGFRKIGEKIVEHRARKYGVTKYGLDRFVKGYLDLLTIGFITRFGKSPMHLFGSLGTIMFLIGFIMAGYLGVRKLIFINQHLRAPLVTDSPYFFIALTVMVIGSFLFLTGFLGELVNRNSSERNTYLMKEKVNA